MLKRLTKWNTYLAIDYGLAFWAYMYLTVSAIAMACVFAVLISLPLLVLAAFSFSTNLLLNLIAALIVCIFMIPFLGVIFGGADSLFVYPYYHLLTQLVPHPSRELIRKDFEPIIRFLCVHVDIEKKKDLRHILRYEESEFTEPL